MKNSSKKLLLLSVLLSSQLVYAEDDAKKLCNQEIKKEVIDKTIVDKYCYETAKEYENKKEYGSASWYYLLSHNDKYNITNLKEYIPLKKSNVIYANMAHSYVLNDDMKNAESLYKEFLKVYGQPNADTQDDYKLLFKLFPDKKEQLNKGLELWNEVYNSLKIPPELDKKYEEAKKSKNYKEAIKYLEEIIKIKEEVLGKEQPTIATNYNSMGYLYTELNDYPKALEYYKKSLAIREKVLGEHEDTAWSYKNIGYVYSELKDYTKALEYHNKALEIREKVLGEHEDTATSYNSIGYVYTELNDYPKALEYFKKSLVIREKVLGIEHADTAISYNNIGNIYLKLNDYLKALEYSNKALIIQEKLLGIEHTDTATSYNNIGGFYSKLKDYPKALEYFTKALVIREKILGINHEDTGTSYSNIGLAYYSMNEHPNAYKYTKKSFDIFIKNRDKNFKVLDNKQKLKYLESNSSKLESLLLSANAYIQELNKNGENDKAKKIKEDSLNDWLNYKGAIFDGENSIAILYDKIEDKNVKAKIEELNSLKQQLSKQYQTVPDPKDMDNYKLKIKELENNISDVEIYLSSQVDEFKEELGLRNVKYQDISKYLNDNEIYVDFSRTKNNYFIFSLDNKNNVTFEKVDKDITNKIDENIQLFRQNVQSIVKSQTILSKDKLDSLNKDAKIILSNLYDNIVVNNLISKIDKFDNKKSLVFSLDGILNYLPLEALYDKQTNQYLIEKKDIKYVPSGREYIRLLNKKDLKNQSSQNVTMFTNPDYGLQLEAAPTRSVLMTPNTRSSQFDNEALFSMEFKPLPGTQKEANVISKLYSNVNDYNKDKATSQNLLKVKSPKILHISTHGFFLNNENIENPMLKSGLAFAGANNAADGDSQGVMTGLRLAGLNLSDTQLVVLSACETGLGDIKGSEGVTGLNKAFIKAGARNIVMSLWSVADKETAELMQDFYQNVKETNKYQESLKESKMKMIKQNVHPYYWSAFIMNGI